MTRQVREHTWDDVLEQNNHTNKCIGPARDAQTNIKIETLCLTKMVIAPLFDERSKQVGVYILQL